MSRHRTPAADLAAMMPVDQSITAPHRYTWDTVDVDGDIKAMSLREFLAASPYKAGEVVYVAYGDGYCRAYISRVFHDYDLSGDRRHQYRVHRETKAGTWSKTWYYTWPGIIQRGYQRAGLAPEMPK